MNSPNLEPSGFKSPLVKVLAKDGIITLIGSNLI
jgi:hypothetical protein